MPILSLLRSMYSAQPNAADSATINPAALASSGKLAATLPSVIHEPSRPLPLSRGAPWPALRFAARRCAARCCPLPASPAIATRPLQCIASHHVAALRPPAHHCCKDLLSTPTVDRCAVPCLSVSRRAAFPVFVFTIDHGSTILMRSLADLLDQNSRGVKRSRSPSTYEVPSPRLAGDEGMLRLILCSCVRSPSTCLMLHDQGSATRA